MKVTLINPANGNPLRDTGDALVDPEGHRFPVIAGVPRICESDNYAQSFGKQWTMFADTQIDRPESGLVASERRFFEETGWTPEELDGLDVLEVGSGAGRFSRVVLERTNGRLWSVDYSAAVEANRATNNAIAPDRFHLFQASIYEMPFPNESFDRVFCLGVLQHTPDFEKSVKALVDKAKPGGEIVVDFYSIRHPLTKLHAKYLLRPWTKRMPHDRLLDLIERNADWLIRLSDAMTRAGLGVLTRFLPLVDLRNFPSGLDPKLRREWAVLDTFDMFSPEHDHPQRIRDVTAMFERSGADVNFAGEVDAGSGLASVVRAKKRSR